MPGEALLRVFRYLEKNDQVSILRVCKSWHGPGRSALLRRANFTLFTAMPDEETVAAQYWVRHRVLPSQRMLRTDLHTTRDLRVVHTDMNGRLSSPLSRKTSASSKTCIIRPPPSKSVPRCSQERSSALPSYSHLYWH